MIFRGGRRYGFEVKFSDAPTPTKSMRIALADLNLDHLFVIYPGAKAYPLADKIEVLPVAELPSRMAGLK